MDAATRVFLAKGFEGASIDEIATAARASKPTIYNRYAGKEALFVAVVESEISRVVLDETPGQKLKNVRGRLADFAQAMLKTALKQEVVDLLRIIIAEAPRFPKLARAADESARRRGFIFVAQILTEAAENGELPALRDANRPSVLQLAEFYLHLAVLPLMMRALVGEDLGHVRSQAAQHVSSATRVFVKSCGVSV
jgi:AcrR family transcriptional regulator